jgi:hypothetical protein
LRDLLAPRTEIADHKLTGELVLGVVGELVSAKWRITVDPGNAPTDVGQAVRRLRPDYVAGDCAHVHLGTVDGDDK